MPCRCPETRLWSDVGPCHLAEKVVWVKAKREFLDDNLTEFVAIWKAQYRRANIAWSFCCVCTGTIGNNAVVVVINSTAGQETNYDDNKKVKGRKSKSKKKKTVKKERPHNRFRHLLRDAKAIAMARMLK